MSGLAWAITTPLCLIHGFRADSGLEALPLPGPSLSRTLYLLGREGEFASLPARIAGHARDTLRTMMSHDLRPIAPWAEAGVAVG